MSSMQSDAPRERTARLHTPTDLGDEARRDMGAALTALVADTVALWLKTKNFHWHMSGPHFRDYHLMLDDQGAEILAMVDVLAERARKLGAPTLRSLGQAASMTRIPDNDADYVEPADMLGELMEDNRALIASFRTVHDLADEQRDVASASLLEDYIDAAERRVWFLFETLRPSQSRGH